MMRSNSTISGYFTVNSNQSPIIWFKVSTLTKDQAKEIAASATISELRNYEQYVRKVGNFLAADLANKATFMKRIISPHVAAPAAG